MDRTVDINGQSFTVQNVDPSISDGDLKRRIQLKYQLDQEPAPTAGDALARHAFGGFVDAVNEIPNAAVTVPLQAGARFVKGMSGGMVDPAQMLADRGMALPEIGQQVFPTALTPEAVQGGAQVAGESVASLVNGGEAKVTPFNEAVSMQEAKNERATQEHPLLAGVGRVLGLAGTMGGLRAATGVGKHRALSELDHAAAQNTFAFGSKAKLAEVVPTVEQATSRKEVFNAFTNSKAFKTLMNRAGRATEAGAEGAVMAILADGDPAETAGFAAGLQASGSLALTGLTGVMKGGISKIGLNVTVLAAGVAGLLEVLDGVAPGGEKSALEALSGGYEKVTLGLLAGIAAGAG